MLINSLSRDDPENLFLSFWVLKKFPSGLIPKRMEGRVPPVLDNVLIIRKKVKSGENSKS